MKRKEIVYTAESISYMTDHYTYVNRHLVTMHLITCDMRMKLT